MKDRPRIINLVLVFVFLFGALGFMPKPIDAFAGDLFFSEYIEGSGYNKALEIYNGTGAVIDLSDYSIELYSNGAESATSTLALSGFLESGEVYVVAHGSAHVDILAVADETSSAINHNGDDAYALRKGTTYVDVIGRIGEQAVWGTEPITTKDNTLVRKEMICTGDTDPTDPFEPADEWDSYGIDYFNDLGNHSAVCESIEIHPEDLFFSEYIEGSSNNKALEIYNGTGAPVDLSGYKVVLYSNGSTSPGNTLIWDSDTLLADGDVYVIANASAAQAILDVADITSNVTFYNGNDVVALQRSADDSLVDVIGTIGDDSYFGAEQTFTRKETICEGDTDPYDPFDPAVEWNIYPQDTFEYLGFHSTNCALPEPGPTVSSTQPTNGAVNVPIDENIVITFSESVMVTDPWYDITCADSGTHTATVTNNNPEFILNPDVDFETMETCTVTIYAAGVTAEGIENPPITMTEDYIFSFTTIGVCGDEYTPIYDIQGSGMSTPLQGKVVTTEGVVVGDFQEGGKNGFFIQDTVGDNNPSTSDGIFIYAPSSMDVFMGDHVRVQGTATEYYGLTQIGSVSEVWLCDTDLPLPEPTEVTLPVSHINDLERYEGMRVIFPQDLVISEYYNFDRYGEIVLTSERFTTPTALYDPGTPEVFAAMEAYTLSSIILDDGRTYQNPDPAIHPNGLEFSLYNLFRGGDYVTNLVGIMDYGFNLYRVQPTEGADYTVVNPRTPSPDIIEGDIKVANFNVLNYFTTIDTGIAICGPSGDMGCRGADNHEELTRQRDKILSALSIIDADVVGLIEIENDRPDLSPDYAVADLVEGLNDLMGAGTYDYIPTGAIGTDAIKVALIYKPAQVTPLGDYAILDSSVDPLFLDDYNRPVLAQSFTSDSVGDAVIVAVNHLKSKGSDCNAVEDPDLGDGAGNCNITRTNAAYAQVQWLESDPTGTGVDNILIIGDLNSYDKEDPIDVIKAGPDGIHGTDDDYFDMIYEILGEDAYSYVFDGRIGYLDYAMVNAKLEKYVADVTIWHINADEPDLIDYDTSFKKPAQAAIYAPDAYRSSDHDPVIITLTFTVQYYLPIVFK